MAKLSPSQRSQRPLQDLIANAWIQGLLDAAEHMAEKAARDA